MSDSNDNKYTLFNTVKSTNQLVVRDSNTWNTVWGLVTAYYWASYPTKDSKLFDALKSYTEKKPPASPTDSDGLEALKGVIKDLIPNFAGDALLSYAIYQDQNTDQATVNADSILFYILNQVGLKNIAYDSDDSTVVLLSYNSTDNSTPSDYYPSGDGNPSSTILNGYNAPFIVKLRLGATLPDPYFKKVDAFYPKINNWTEITGKLIIKLPPLDIDTAAAKENITPTEALSRYSAFVPYYPFGFQYTHDYDSLPIVSTLTATVQNNNAKQPSLGLFPGDRGGVQGAEDDIRWLHFVPRMVAFNWDKGNRDIKPGSELASYKDLLEAFEYQIPEGLSIQLDYAEGIPSTTCPKTLQDYVSIMEIVLPTPPEENFQPIALADFAAKRASLPFTCA